MKIKTKAQLELDKALEKLKGGKKPKVKGSIPKPGKKK